MPFISLPLCCSRDVSVPVPLTLLPSAVNRARHAQTLPRYRYASDFFFSRSHTKQACNCKNIRAAVKRVTLTQDCIFSLVAKL